MRELTVDEIAVLHLDKVSADEGRYPLLCLLHIHNSLFNVYSRLASD